MRRPFPQKIAHLHGAGSGPSSNTWLPGPTTVLNLNGISIGSAVYAGLTSATDQQTDRLTAALDFRLHRSITYVDAAYCYRPSSMVCWSLCHTSEPCKNGYTHRDAAWVEDLGGPREPCIIWGCRSPMGRGNFEGGGTSSCKV